MQNGKAWHRQVLRLALAALLGMVAALPARANVVEWEDLPWDERIGASWFEQKAADGEVAAMYRAGELHERGIGTPPDVGKAILWYRKAAEAGHVKAQYRLARLLHSGTKITSEAIRWYRAAAEQGLPQAQFNLAKLKDRGIGTAKDPAGAAELYRNAIEGGIAQAAIFLAELHLTGRGVEKDLVEALAWFDYAAKHDVTGAVALRDRLASQASEAQREEAMARASSKP